MLQQSVTCSFVVVVVFLHIVVVVVVVFLRIDQNEYIFSVLFCSETRVPFDVCLVLGDPLRPGLFLLELRLPAAKRGSDNVAHVQHPPRPLLPGVGGGLHLHLPAAESAQVRGSLPLFAAVQLCAFHILRVPRYAPLLPSVQLCAFETLRVSRYAPLSASV